MNIPRDLVARLSARLAKTLTYKTFSSAAGDIAELSDAERLGLISDEWRRGIDVSAAERGLREQVDEITEDWHRMFKRNRTIIEFGGILVLEEMILVLCSRDELHLLPRYMDEDPRDQLVDLDDLLRELGEANPDAMWEARANVDFSLGQYLPDHWWWRMRDDVAPVEDLAPIEDDEE